MTKWYTSTQSWLKIQKINNVIYNINRIITSNHLSKSRKVFDKIQYSLVAKTLNKVGKDTNVLILIKGMYENPVRHHFTSTRMAVIKK